MSSGLPRATWFSPSSQRVGSPFSTLAVRKADKTGDVRASVKRHTCKVARHVCMFTRAAINSVRDTGQGKRYLTIARRPNDLSKFIFSEKLTRPYGRGRIRVAAVRKSGNGYGRISHSLHSDKNPHKSTVNFRNPPPLDIAGTLWLYRLRKEWTRACMCTTNAIVCGKKKKETLLLYRRLYLQIKYPNKKPRAPHILSFVKF